MSNTVPTQTYRLEEHFGGALVHSMCAAYEDPEQAWQWFLGEVHCHPRRYDPNGHTTLLLLADGGAR